MTEAEWLATTAPTPLVEWLSQRGTTERKWGLFSLACCRQVQRHIPDWPSAGLVDVLEEFADGRVDAASIPERIVSEWMPESPYINWSGPHLFDLADAVLNSAFAPVPSDPLEMSVDGEQILRSRPSCPTGVVIDTNWVFQVTGLEASNPATSLVPILRDIFGNPFRPIALNPSWLTSTVVALARQMYDTRDFSAMPILADALQDAGCDNADVLNHCRGDGVHVRGCFVVDMLLGKG